MNTKMIEYQMFTKCNLKCSYCYNYFDQTVSALETHIEDLRKISSLADRKTCMVINGGEPLMFKELAKLVNSVEVQTNILTYTNGALPLKVYEKFVGEVRKDNLYFTISIHYAELIRTNNINEDYKANLKYLIQNLPNVKVNIVFTEDFADAAFLGELIDLLRELHGAGLKYINILLEDSLKNEPHRALKLVRTPHFEQFFDDLRIFKYKHCMWNNKDDDISCLHIWLRKECMSPPLPYKEMSFLKHGDGFVVENNFGFVSNHVEYAKIDGADTYRFKPKNTPSGKITNIDAYIEEVRPLLG